MPKILMIDDDPSLTLLVRQVLTRAGWTFLSAANGDDGLRMVAENRPDIILLDIRLPDADGYALCARLKGDHSTRHIPLVLISAVCSGVDDIVRGLGPSGADAYMVKPMNVEVLQAKLEAVLKPYVRTHAKA